LTIPLDTPILAAMSGRAGPIITLTTDFGLTDWYVAAMKAVLLRHCPDARLVDVTHEVGQGDILGASIALERAIHAFGEGTIHLAVVDPGVGSGRRLLVANIAGQTVVVPDNGLVTWAWRRRGAGTAWEIVWMPNVSSNTFHGRDILAPVAGMIAAGMAVEKLARPMTDPVLLDIAPAEAPASSGVIIHIDHFGNCTTNIPGMALAGPIAVRTGGAEIGMYRTYSDVGVGQSLALIGSSDLLEIAVRDGSAAEDLGLKVGDAITIVPAR
jgi:S-adenosyl-L-methionine hydrolase (adenosine-forming)